MRPIVIARHLIFTACGWWLPNDPRGSASRTIRSDVIAELGELHFGRRRVQPARDELIEFFDAARNPLKHGLVEFSMEEIGAIASSFAQCVTERRYTCWACALMPDHVHIVIRKHRDQAEDMIAHLQQASREALKRGGKRPVSHPVWGGAGRKAFLDSPDDVRRTIRYVEENPTRISRPRQASPFVKPYDNWPLHDGHDPNSPYARALRAEGRYPMDRRR